MYTVRSFSAALSLRSSFQMNFELQLGLAHNSCGSTAFTLIADGNDDFRLVLWVGVGGDCLNRN